MHIELTSVDGYVVLSFLGVILSAGIYFLIKQESSTDSYFFAGRRMGWLTIGASLFSSQFLLGLVFPMTGTLLSAAVTVMGCVVMTVAAVFVARHLSTRVLAAGLFADHSELRNRIFHRPLRRITPAALTALLIVVRLIAVFLFFRYAFEQLLGWDPGTYMIGIVLFAGFYTIVGGFQAVIVTQAFQAVPVFAAILTLAFMGGNDLVGSIGAPEGLSLLSRLGLLLLVVWSWGGDYYIVQHTMGAGSRDDSKKGVTAAVLLNVVCLAVVILLAVDIAPVISVAAVREPLLGWRGIVTAGILAVTMAQLAGIFSSGAAFFTMKIFKPLHADASERTLVLVGRLATTSIVVASIAAVMIGRLIGHDGLRFLQTAAGMIGAPIAALWCVSLFRRDDPGAGAGLALGASAAIGGVRLALEALMAQGAVLNEWAVWLLSIHYLSLAAVMFMFTVVLLAGRNAQREAVRYLAFAKSEKKSDR